MTRGPACRIGPSGGRFEAQNAPSHREGPGLRRISTPDRQTAVALIVDAVTAGARCGKACAVLEIRDRTLRRWTKDSQINADQRPLV